MEEILTVTKAGAYMIRTAMWVFVFVFASSNLQSFEQLYKVNLLTGGPVEYVYLFFIALAGIMFVKDSLTFTRLIQDLGGVPPYLHISNSLGLSDKGREGEVKKRNE